MMPLSSITLVTMTEFAFSEDGTVKVQNVFRPYDVAAGLDESREEFVWSYIHTKLSTKACLPPEIQNAMTACPEKDNASF